jgi:endoglucanase
VWVHGVRRLPGVFGSVPPHFSSPDQRKPYEFTDLFVDVGLSGKDAARVVAVGDLVSLRSPLLELSGDRVSGRALDNRASVVAALLALEMLSKWNHSLDVLVAATTMEEVGRSICVGAATAAMAEAPDYGITLDVTHGDMPGLEEPQAYKLGGGPVLAVGPHIHPAMFRAFVQTAEKEKIPFQVEPAPSSTGTEVGEVQTAGEGVPAAVAGIPLRYMHSAVETASMTDVERLARLVARFVVRLESGLPELED